MHRLHPNEPQQLISPSGLINQFNIIGKPEINTATFADIQRLDVIATHHLHLINILFKDLTIKSPLINVNISKRKGFKLDVLPEGNDII